MLPPSRNAPCPCGSGRKYKHCCLSRNAGPAPGAGPDTDRSRAWSRLMRFAGRDEFAAARGVAMQLFWDLPDEEDLPPELARAMKADLPAFFEWFTLDLPMEDDGATMVELLLEREGAALRDGERDFLQRMSATALRLYEIAAVRRDEGLELTDLWTGATVPVRERLATRELVRWDLLAVRLSEWPDGVLLLEGQPMVFPPSAKEELVRGLRGEYRRYRKGTATTEPLFFKRVVPQMLNLYRLDLAVPGPAPVVTTVQGESLVITRVHFEAVAPAGLAGLLAGHPELEQEPGRAGWVWFEEAGGGMHRLLGRIELSGTRLMLETMSEERGARGRGLLEALLGDRIRHLATTCEDVMEAVKRKGPAAGPPRREPLPPEVEAEAVTRFLDRHYREWLDIPVPALGHRTPRHAARLKTIRPRLEQLLRQFENHAERDRLEGRPGYDFGWLRVELGLAPERGAEGTSGVRFS